MHAPSDRDARIRDRAYQIWLGEGRRHGHHDAHWQQAEREIAAEEAGAAGATRTTAKPPVASEADPPTVSRARAKNEAATKTTRSRAATAANADAQTATARSTSRRPVSEKT